MGLTLPLFVVSPCPLWVCLPRVGICGFCDFRDDLGEIRDIQAAHGDFLNFLYVEMS